MCNCDHAAVEPIANPVWKHLIARLLHHLFDEVKLLGEQVVALHGSQNVNKNDVSEDAPQPDL